MGFYQCVLHPHCQFVISHVNNQLHESDVKSLSPKNRVGLASQRNRALASHRERQRAKSPPRSHAVRRSMLHCKGTPEEELSVQIGHIDGVHVNHMNVFKSGESQILQYLTP